TGWTGKVRKTPGDGRSAADDGGKRKVLERGTRRVVHGEIAQTPAAAQHRAATQRRREANAGGDIAVIGGNTSRAADAIFTSHEHGRRSWIEIGEPIVLFHFLRKHVITNAEVQ